MDIQELNYRRNYVIFHLPFLKMCIRSLDSSTLPSASITPGNRSGVVVGAGVVTDPTVRRTEPSAVVANELLGIIRLNVFLSCGIAVTLPEAFVCTPTA